MTAYRAGPTEPSRPSAFICPNQTVANALSALEDKIVQQALRTVVEQIYEEDFLGFSYGFRPGKSQHNALDALAVGLRQRKVSWVLDADICGFLIRMVSNEWYWMPRRAGMRGTRSERRPSHAIIHDRRLLARLPSKPRNSVTCSRVGQRVLHTTGSRAAGLRKAAPAAHPGQVRAGPRCAPA